MPDMAEPAPEFQGISMPAAQFAKPIEVDDVKHFPYMTDWGVTFWLEEQFDEGGES